MSFEKLQILEEVLGSFYRSNDEHLFFCPYCKHHKRKLSVNISKNTFKCWICDSRSRNVYGLIKKFGNHSQKQLWRSFEEEVDLSEFDNIFEEKTIEETTQRIKLPNEYSCLANKNLPSSANIALKYLKKRGINSYDILKWKIGYCENGEYKNRIVVPSFNLDGYCDYFIARTYSEDWLKYKNPPASKNVVFNELMIDWSEPITLVEGAFDAVVATNSVPLLGSTLTTRSKLFRAILTHSKRVYVALDHDAEKKALNIIKSLISYGVEVYKISTSGYEDIAEMSKEEFETNKQKAKMFDFNSLLLQKIMEA